jgi:hypothetical protein
MPEVNRKPSPDDAGKPIEQSILLPRKWPRERVVKWLEDHDYITRGIEDKGEDAKYWHARQYDPEHFMRHRQKPRKGSPEIQIVWGVVKGRRKDGRIGASRVEYGMVVDSSDSDDGPWAIRLADGSLLLNRVPIMRECVNRYGDRSEYKSWNDVKDAASTFEDATITYLHPEGRMVDAESFRSVGRGHIKGPFVEDEKNRIVWGKAHIADAELIEEVLAKRALGVSPGFFCEPFDEPGQAPDGTAYDGRQLFMTGNHFAFGPTEQWARGGSQMQVALDGHGDVILGAEQASDINTNQEEAKLPEVIMVDGKPFQTTEKIDGLEDAIKAYEAKMTKLVTDAQAERDKAQGELAAEKKAHKKTQTRLDASESPAERAKWSQARSELMKKAELVSGDPKFTSDSDELGVMIEALKADGQDLSEIESQGDGFKAGFVTSEFNRLAKERSSEQKAITDAYSGDPNQKPPAINPPPGGEGNGGIVVTDSMADHMIRQMGG